MNDDWRVELDLAEDSARERLLEEVRELQVAREARRRLGDRVVISADGPRMYAYAESEEQAREAERVLLEALGRHGVRAEATVRRWHPEDGRWEDPANRPAAVSAGSRIAEADEELPEWEVRVELPGHREAVELANRLEAEGLPFVRRWRVLLLGARTEDEARALADRVRAEAPPGSRVLAEGNEAIAWDRLHPFAVLGGLAN